MDHLASLLLGLGNGGVYAALALALVITYRASGVVNFATGAIALYVAYTYAGLRRGELLVPVPGLPKTIDVGGEMGFGPAVAISLIVGAALGGLLYLLVFRPLRDAPPLAKAVASLGVLVVLQGALAIRQGTNPVSVAAIFPAERWELGSVTLLADRFFLAVTVVGLAVALAAGFRFTRFGLVTRAAAESQTGAFVSGVSPDRVALVNWMLSAVIAGLAGILIAPVSPLTPVTYTLFVVPALAAAVVGRFQHLIPIVVAAIAIGMLQSEALSLAAQHSWLPQTGSFELVPLVVILVALVAVGGGMPVRGGLVRQRLGHAPRPRSLLLPAAVGTAVGVAALVLTSGSWRAAVIGTFIAAVIGLSLVVVTGYAGQVSLAQLALAGAAAFTLSGLTEGWGVPFPFAPLLAALVATGVGVVVGLPALRLRGLTLGVVTLALAYAIEAVWFRNADIVSSSGARVTPPSMLGIDLGIGAGKDFPRIGFGLLCLFTLVVVAVGVAALRRSALGSAMLAVRANERSAAAVGVNVVRVKVLAFALASFIAGLGGSLLAYRRGVVTFDSFTAIGGLALLSTAYLAGVTSVWGGINAGILASTGIVFIALDRWVDLGAWFQVITGVLLIATLIAHPEGIASGGHRLADRVARPRAGRGASDSGGEGPAVAAGAPPVEEGERPPDHGPAREPAAASATEPALRVENLRVRYGGVVAVADVSLRVDRGSIVGLIGPNGAGKTSVIDAITGFARATGSIELAGRHIEGLAPHARVRAGLGRTFQQLELYDDLSVEENVSVAAFGGRRDNRRAAVARALHNVGISALADRPAGELSQGERQLVSIARACVAEPSVLLLDEPAAGLDTAESALLGDRIRELRSSGTAVLLVDHDVALVLRVCDRVYVLDFGAVIAEGSPDAIRTNRAVADAYLGALHDAEAVSA
ncbi:MAG TPA: branched-chain amino acid ABC transporter permease/ATP-binding protein [Acidimicrobiales bacterium]|nr:branched-chain amino acid ABC transporter permease/ATP-binding protein [Acidimicrobiales bacterium]